MSSGGVHPIVQVRLDITEGVQEGEVQVAAEIGFDRKVVVIAAVDGRPVLHLSTRFVNAGVDGREPIRQTSPHRLLLHQRVTQRGQNSDFLIKFDEVDRDLHDLAREHGIPVVATIRQPVPEILARQMAVAIRKSRIEHQTQRVQQIALTGPVLTYDHRTRLQR